MVLISTLSFTVLGILAAGWDATAGYDPSKRDAEACRGRLSSRSRTVSEGVAPGIQNVVHDSFPCEGLSSLPRGANFL